MDDVINQSGFIPTENMKHWRESLNDDQRKALDDYMDHLFDDAETNELEAF